MTISYMPVESCPKCGQVLDYFNTFSTHGKQCRYCKWREEIDNFTGKEYEPQTQKGGDAILEGRYDVNNPFQ